MFPSTSAVAAARLTGASRPDHVARRRIFLPLAVLAVLSWAANSSYAIEIVSIEEHWELRVGLPDAGSSSPQVSMVMSPTSSLDDEFFVFTLNHHSAPEWIPGGLQVQHWKGEQIVAGKVGQDEGMLHHADETISWVQRTSLHEGQLIFEVVNGQSESWGSFGDLGNLRFSSNTNLGNLNGYRPAISIEESGVSFGGNRVASLTLKKLRWTDSNGQVYELNAPIDVDADLDP